MAVGAIGHTPLAEPHREPSHRGLDAPGCVMISDIIALGAIRRPVESRPVSRGIVRR
jgi:hypothetical protein